MCILVSFINQAYPLLTLKNPLLFGFMHLNVSHVITKVNYSSLCLCVYLFCLSVDNK